MLPEQRAGALLLSAYAQAASSARERFGARTVEEPDHRLPAPVVCIHEFNFIPLKTAFVTSELILIFGRLFKRWLAMALILTFVVFN